MSIIKCEMCGSNQLTKIDGLYQCQFCGTKYTPEEAKKLIVSGTVEVVKGNAEKERLLKNAKYFIEHKQFNSALQTIEKLKFDFPSEKEIHELYNQYSLSKKLYDFEQEKDNVIKIIDLCLRSSNNEKLNIGSHLTLMNNLRKQILDLDKTFATELNRLETDIVEKYNKSEQAIIHKKRFLSEVLCWANGIVNEEYRTVFVNPPIVYSEILSNWINKVEERIVSMFRISQISINDLFFSKLYDVFNEVPKIDFSILKQRKLLMLIYEGIQCGKYLDSHQFIFEDIILNMDKFYLIRASRYYGSGRIEFALGKEFIYLSDNEYGPVYDSWATKISINSIKDLEKVAEERNPNSYCSKCGSKLIGLFSKRCSRCSK